MTSTRPAGARSSRRWSATSARTGKSSPRRSRPGARSRPTATAGQLHFASEPRRQELIRRLNRAPRGTSELVAMRADLLALMNGRSGSCRARSRRRASVGLMVQQGVSRAAPDRLVDTRQHPGTDHPLRGRARDQRLGRSAPPHRSGRPALLRLLPSGAGRRAPDLRRGGADGDDPDRDRAAACGRPAAGRDRARPHRGVLFDLQHPARPGRHFLRQLPDQAGGRGIAPRIAEARYLRDAVAGAGLHAMAEAGQRCPRSATRIARC